MALLTTSFGSTIPNRVRRRNRNAFPTPEVEAARCPKLDPVFRTKSVKAEAKSADGELARIQAFVHDPVGPMVELLLGLDAETESQLSLEDTRVALSDAIKLLGNASTRISKLRIKIAIAQEKQNKYHDFKHGAVSCFKVGSVVLKKVFTHKRRRRGKLDYQLEGTFKDTKSLGKGLFHLTDTQEIRVCCNCFCINCTLYFNRGYC